MRVQVLIDKITFMSYQKNDVLQWRNPETEEEKADVMVVIEPEDSEGRVWVRQINRSVVMEQKVPVSATEFLGQCSIYEPASEVIARYRK